MNALIAWQLTYSGVMFGSFLGVITL